MTEPVIITPDLGDRVYLGSFLSRNDIWGVVSDLDTPDQASMSWEVAGGNGYITVPVIQGRRGATGSNAPAPDLQLAVFDDPAELPTNLTDDDVDIGKYWVVREFDEEGDPVGSKVYIWYGDHYEWFQMGTEGPPGPVPIISFGVELLDPDDPDLENEVVITGDAHHPSVLLKIKAPRGPQGLDAAWDLYDEPTAPEVGDFPQWNGTHYVPSTTGMIVPKYYTMPEAAFVDVPLAIGTTVPIGSFVVPAQEWDVVPYVTGHMRITGIEADMDPLIIGAEVRLGTAGGGAVVARGYGNISTYVDLKPHASTTATPNDAITPDNGRAVIPAGTTGAAATLYVNAFNDGVAGIYHFEKRGAQLAILLLPVES